MNQRFVVAVRCLVGLFFGAVRIRRGEASEPRQALIGATVVCPHLPRFPGGTFLPCASGKIAVEHFHFLAYQWRRMIQFSLFNIPIRVLPWFWLTLAFIGGATRIREKEQFFLLLLFLIAGFISILVHELGHALTAKAFGKRVEIVLQAFGGYAAYSGGAPLDRTRTFLVTAAGPALQIVLGGAVYFFAESFPGMSFQATYFVKVLYMISLAWAVLNLLPVLPLDGGRILQTILGPGRIKVTLMISIVVAVSVGILYYMKTGDILLPIFMGMFAYQSLQALKEQP